MVADVRRFDVCLVNLDPTLGSEIRKTRPCVVVSPDEMNAHVRTVIIAPMISARRAYPTRVNIAFEGRKRQVALDQIRTVDKSRLVTRLGRLSRARAELTCPACWWRCSLTSDTQRHNSCDIAVFNRHAGFRRRGDGPHLLRSNGARAPDFKLIQSF